MGGAFKRAVMTTKKIRSPKNRNQGRKPLGAKKRIKTSISIPPGLFEKIKADTGRTGDSLSETACKIIDIYYSQKTLKI